ncbi:MAG: hypothetical protein OEM52_07755 [bacterium]|nr:hypothetical protein [bacterium]
MRSIFVTLLIVVSAFGYSWQNITSGNRPFFNGNIRWNNNPMVASRDTLFAATLGGLFYRTPHHDRMWTVSDGYLSTNKLSAITTASDGGVWVGAVDASITHINPMTGNGERITLLQNEPDIFEIQLLREFNRVLFVSTAAGITRVSYHQSLQRWVIDATYRDFGTVGRLPVVYDIRLFRDTLWVATNRGLAYANWNDPLLQSPSAWSTISELNNREVYDCISYQDGLAVATSNGCYTLSGTTVSQRRSGWIHHIAVYNDSLIFCASNGIQRVADNTIIGSDSTSFSFFSASGANLFTYFAETDSTYGKYATYDANSDQWIASSAQTALYPNLTGAVRLPNGGLALMAGGERTRGVYIFQENRWEYRTRMTSPPQYSFFFVQDPNVIACDAAGNIWEGTNGGGLAIFYPDSMQHFDHTAATGAHLREYDNNRQPVVSAISFLSNGRVIVLNYDPVDDAPLVVLPEGAGMFPGWENGTWRRIGLADGMPGSKMNRMVIDPWDRVWMGSSYAGTQRLVVYDFRGTIDTYSDDAINSFGEESGLPEDLTISAMAIGADAVLYLATTFGLYYGRITEDPAGMRFYPLSVPISNIVVSLAADATGQIWVGTDHGLALLSADGQTWLESFTKTSELETTGLSTDYIGSMSFSPRSGELFIVNEGGIAVLSTPFRQYGTSIGKIEPAPNPFRNDGQNHLKFGDNGLVANAEVRLFTVSGLLVRKLTFVEAAGIGWDGKNEEGERVASGVYYIVVTSPDGKNSLGKVAVIRP